MAGKSGTALIEDDRGSLERTFYGGD